jgi:hypothetical protein
VPSCRRGPQCRPKGFIARSNARPLIGHGYCERSKTRGFSRIYWAAVLINRASPAAGVGLGVEPSRPGLLVASINILAGIIKPSVLTAPHLTGMPSDMRM